MTESREEALITFITKVAILVRGFLERGLYDEDEIS